MTIQTQIIPAPDQDPAWDAALQGLPRPHVLQTAAWAAFKARHGWAAWQVWFREEGTVRALASVLVRRLPGLPWGVGYAPKGPCLAVPSDEGLWGEVLAGLEAFACRQRLILLKIDPDVDLGPDGMGDRVAAVLRGRGWAFSPEQVQFRNTVTLDLTPDPDDVLMAMHPKTRYNVRLAGRRGVEVIEPGPEALPDFYRLYQETSQRDGFLIRPFDYYRDVWSTFLGSGMARLLLARHEGDLLAGLITFQFGGRAWYMYGASSSEKRNLMPNHLLQWEAMCRARADGVREYDFWGAPDRLDESDPMWGVYRFKTGFGGEFVQRIGAYDYPASRLLYHLYVRLMPRILDLMRARHRLTSP